MRTKHIISIGRLAVALALLGLAGIIPTRVQAEPSPDLVNSLLRTQEQAAKVTQGGTVAMVCSKCRTVLVSESDKKKGFLAWFGLKTKHECAGCGGEFSMKDVPAGQGGKLSVAEYFHTCSKCGDDSTFCCAIKSGRSPTKGMERKRTEQK